MFYEVRVHLAENADDFVGKKGTTVSMGIRKVGCEVLSVYWRGGWGLEGDSKLLLLL